MTVNIPPNYIINYAGSTLPDQITVTNPLKPVVYRTQALITQSSLNLKVLN